MSEWLFLGDEGNKSNSSRSSAPGAAPVRDNGPLWGWASCATLPGHPWAWGQAGDREEVGEAVPSLCHAVPELSGLSGEGWMALTWLFTLLLLPRALLSCTSFGHCHSPAKLPCAQALLSAQELPVPGARRAATNNCVLREPGAGRGGHQGQLRANGSVITHPADTPSLPGPPWAGSTGGFVVAGAAEGTFHCL